MKKSALILWMLFMIVCVPAQAALEQIVEIHPSLPKVVISVKDGGETDESLERPNLLHVSICAQDNSFSQTVTYRSLETADYNGIVPLVVLQDINRDGYQDLLLLTAQGARNVFQAVSLWDAERQTYRPVMQGHAWDSQGKGFSFDRNQLELCNFDAADNCILSSVADGYRFRTEIVYQWEGKYALAPASVLDVYDAGEGAIGELLQLHATWITCCWDTVYPEAWYYGSAEVNRERRASAYLLMLGDGLTKPRYAQVANVNWVNLRKQDSKASPSLARLNAGTEVQILEQNCGEDGGWVRVWVRHEGDVDDPAPGLTGYIWHSYLEE